MTPTNPLMRTSLFMRRPRFLLLLAALTAGCHAPATSQGPAGPAELVPATEQFDLLVYGAGFHSGEHEVFLLTNLDFGAEWVSLGTLAGHAPEHDGWTTAVFAGLDSRRFLGHDFRERVLPVRIVTADAGDSSRVAALYVVPHLPGTPDHAPRITRLIETDPEAVEGASIASHVQPAPAILDPGAPYIEHVRAPMRHTLPGVAEVEQLQLEWRHRDP